MWIKPPLHAGRCSRRVFLRGTALGFGSIALADLLARAETGSGPLAPRAPHFPARAQRVIFLFMHGGPSSIDTFDPKPRLVRDHGQPLPIARPLAFDDEHPPGPLMKPLWEFKARGESGIPVSDLFPETGAKADELCIIRSMVGEGVDHGAALLQTFTGTSTFTRPSLGAWVLYGLGNENQNLPGFVTLKPTLAHGGAKNWGAAFLPGAFQGTAIGYAGLKLEDLKDEPIEHLRRRGLTLEQQRYELDFLKSVNDRHAELNEKDPALESRVHAFEQAFRMQAEAPDVLAVDREPESLRKLYGLDDPLTADFGWQCLLARRLAERGVRFIQCNHSFKWDQHDNLFELHTRNAKEVDRPIAALLTDLKSRDLLRDTLVVWAGEFGRTPVSQGGDGRDHNPYGYTIWMAGGGVKGGFVYGATDEIGYYAVEDRMHVHDFHATVLHLLGIDHRRLTYRHAGRDFRLTDVAGVVAQKILA